MQLILSDNSIHLKCTPQDVHQFQQETEVEDSVVFGETFGDKFIFALRTSHSYEELHVSLIANELRIFVPKLLAHEWCTTDRIGFGDTMNVGEGRELNLYVEKIFPHPEEVTPNTES